MKYRRSVRFRTLAPRMARTPAYLLPSRVSFMLGVSFEHYLLRQPRVENLGVLRGYSYQEMEDETRADPKHWSVDTGGNDNLSRGGRHAGQGAAHCCAAAALQLDRM